jgi:riboflavin biosynthesis pyrimidine reductase
VIDAGRRLAGDRKLFRDGPPTLLFCSPEAPGADRLGHATVRRVPLAAGAPGLDLAAILDVLAGLGLRRVLVEGGGLTVSRFLAAGKLDRLHVTLAPLLLGDGVPAFSLPCPARPADGLRLAWTTHRLGADLLLDIPLARARPPACA